MCMVSKYLFSVFMGYVFSTSETQAVPYFLLPISGVSSTLDETCPARDISHTMNSMNEP